MEYEMFKFKKCDKIHVKFTEMFSVCFGASVPDPCICSEITDRRRRI